MQNSFYFTAPEVALILGVSRGQAYKIVKELNEELGRNGFLTIAGKIPKQFLAEHYYGLDQNKAEQLLQA